MVVCGGVGMTDLRGEENAGKGGVVRVLLWVSLLREREREREVKVKLTRAGMRL